MANKKNDKKPIVNWFGRKKEVSYSDSTNADGEKVKIKTKVVTAPDSKISKGFVKKKVSAEQERMYPKLGTSYGAFFGSGLLGVSSSDSYEKKKSEKSLQKFNSNPPPKGYTPNQIEKNKSSLKQNISNLSKSSRNSLIAGIAAPLVGMAVDKARGKTKQVTVSKTKTKNK